AAAAARTPSCRRESSRVKTTGRPRRVSPDRRRRRLLVPLLRGQVEDCYVLVLLCLLSLASLPSRLMTADLFLELPFHAVAADKIDDSLLMQPQLSYCLLLGQIWVDALLAAILIPRIRKKICKIILLLQQLLLELQGQKSLGWTSHSTPPWAPNLGRLHRGSKHPFGHHGPLWTSH
ncbi:unnamed protein product, partial [Urochloa humidicola]